MEYTSQEVRRLGVGEVFSLDEPTGESRWKVVEEKGDLIVLIECVGTTTQPYRSGMVAGRRADFLDGGSGPETGARRLICRAVVLRGEP